MNTSIFPVLLQDNPVTTGQEALWLLHQLFPASGIYNTQMVWDLPAELDLALFKRALTDVAARHPGMRARFEMNAEGKVRQRVYDHIPLRFDEVNLGNCSDADFSAHLHEQLHRPFNLQSEVPARWVLYRREQKADAIAVYQHHIAVDLWTQMAVMNDLKLAYAALQQNQVPQFAEIQRTYSEFVCEQCQLVDSDKGAELSEYWHNRLEGMSQVLDLPLDHPRPPQRTCNKQYLHFTIDAQCIEQFQTALSDTRYPLFALYEAVFHVLLYRYTGQNDIAVGIPTAGRDDSYQGVYGYFSNAVVLRAQMNGGDSFQDFIQQHAANIDQSLAAKDYPFSLLASQLADNRDPARSPLVQVCFVWENINRFENRDQQQVFITESGHQIWKLGAMGEWLRHPVVQQLDDFDLTLKVYKFKNTLHFGIEYNGDLFARQSIERMADHYKSLMQSIADDVSTPIGALNLLTTQERQQVYQQVNQTRTDYDRNDLFVHQFSRQAAAQPEAIAIRFGNRGLTYDELERQSNQLANMLLHQQLGPETCIGVFLERSPQIVIAFLGILKAGAVYLPLDPEYPQDRIELIIADSNPALIVSSPRLAGQIEAVHPGLSVLPWENGALDAVPVTAPVTALGPQQLAYIIYTSGSTGKPKGVLIEHGNLAHLIATQRAVFPLNQQDVVLQFASVNFDASIFEMVLALQSGATLQLANKGDLLGDNLLTLLKTTHTRWALLPPALLAHLEPQALPDLNTLVVGGDACSADLAQKWSQGRRMFNAYGPTEYSVWATTTQIDGSTPPPIGKPVANTQIYILDAHLNPQPVGVPGELYIGGDGLARGYLQRDALTAERFIANPFDDRHGSRLYKTGDLARLLTDGNIEFLGRLDHQVKVRGFRIELGEIETTLRQHPAVHDVLVMARDDVANASAGEKSLVAYIVKNASESVESSALRGFLAKKLPAYMVPSAFIMLDAFPLTPNEKIDRKALPLPSANDRASRSWQRQAPRNEIERIIAAAWRECLGLEDVSIRENFFDLGGHSLLLARVHALLPEFLQQKLTVVDLYKYPTIRSLSHFVDSDIEEDDLFIDQDEHTERLRLRRRLMASISGVKIAIVGMAGRFPGADTVDEFWHNICDKKESITFFTPEELAREGVPEEMIRDPNYVPAKGVLKDVAGFDAAFFGFTPREAQITDPQQRLFLECAWQALEDAGCVPDQFNGRIGVYGGVGINQYLANNLSSQPDILAAVGDYPLILGNDKDFLCTRVSYKLNLNGPAMVVQTACSTSLVAVHTACQALLSEECDAALAGGVSLSRLGNTGYFYHEGMIMSPDGHCRSFDANAAGTVQGQGCGIVMLKRLDDALQNNDHIYAVISGSATNNDGSNKTGYTAPSVEGQAKAIRLAQASANISPSQITYIEAHGTGTPIGDPIEVEALRQTFRTDTRADTAKTCAIGSVKSNIGHLDAAAGVAGLIKTAKALEQKKLPPTLHFEKPNPKINFASSSFYVNTQLRDWKTDGDKRYAGVSSFGMGGTNAHVILTQAPSETPVDVARPWNLLTLSARTPAALESMTERLVQYLKTNPQQNFSNICYTLHVGRTLFSHRRHLVCRNAEQAIAELSLLNSQQVMTSYSKEKQKKIVFMFSGQGSQYVNMGRHLYQVELTFRNIVDECRAKISSKFIHVYEELSSADSKGLTDKIHQTYITQPGLFIFEYALAKTLMSWGVEPDYMIGHSIGEYVAACLAGVFTLDQALELVAIRGQLMQELESGDMLSARISEQEALLLTNHDVSLAAVNGEQRCVFSGASHAIQYLHTQLNKRGIENRILHTSHAFHSHMMEPMLERFQAYVRRREPKAPQKPFVSSLSGEWITEQQATSPQYWSDHLRHCVRFHQGMNTLLSDRETLQAEDGYILLEVGPGKVLTTLARQNTARMPSDSVLAVTRHAYEDVSDTQHLLSVLGRLWEQGVAVDWDAFYSNRQHYRVSLPTYPFERQSYWVEAKQPHASAALLSQSHESAGRSEEDDEPMPETSVAPRNNIEDALWEAWANSLGRTDFGIYENFFDLGGDSLLAVNLIDQLQRTFQAPLSAPALIKMPTIAELSDYLQSFVGTPQLSHNSAIDNSPLIQIQRGSEGEVPLIMVHPIGGEVFFYRDLARHLGRRQPLFAIQAPSLSGAESPMTSVYQLAERYVSEIQNSGIKPPYLLGGASFGGLVAYEMAQQLEAVEQEVRLLVMIDTPAPAQMPNNLTDSAAILQYLLQGQLPLSLEKMRELETSAQIDYVLNEARIQGKANVLPPHLGVPLFNTWIAHQEATFDYQPQSYRHDVVFFRHSEPMENFPPLTHQPWLELVEGKMEVLQVPGNHISMNYAPHVRVLAEHLKMVLKKYR